VHGAQPQHRLPYQAESKLPISQPRVATAMSGQFKAVEQNWHSESQATCDKLKGIEAAVIVFRENYLDTIAIDTLYKRVRAND